MQKWIPGLVLTLTVLLSGAGAAAGQSAGQTSSAQASGQVPLRVQLVVSRYTGDKKVSSVPYTLAVVANDNQKTSMRMGVDVPVPQTVFTGPTNNASIPMASYSYRSIGTNIDCTAKSADAGLFRLELAVSNTSVFIPEKAASTSPHVEGVPAFRSFTSTFNVLLKDGQSAQHTSATDPISGEVLRVDVTVTVLK